MKVQLQIGDQLRTVVLEPGASPGAYTGELDAAPFTCDALIVMPGVLSLLMRGGPFAGRSFRCLRNISDAGDQKIRVGDQEIAYSHSDPRSLQGRGRRADAAEGTLLLKATMAGRVVRLLVEQGATAEANSGVIVVEAMKMQNEIRTPRAGKVGAIKVQAGAMVSAGQVLAEIE